MPDTTQKHVKEDTIYNSKFLADKCLSEWTNSIGALWVSLLSEKENSELTHAKVKESLLQAMEHIQ